jgi:hypothetical protein
LYIYKILVYIKSNLNLFTNNSRIHSYNTGNEDDLFIVPCKDGGKVVSPARRPRFTPQENYLINSWY